MACATLEGCLSCSYSNQYRMHWSNATLSFLVLEHWNLTDNDSTKQTYFQALLSQFFVSIRKNGMLPCPKQLVIFLKPLLCYVSLIATLCVISVSRSVIPSSWATLLSPFLSLSLCLPLSGHLKSLFLSAVALFYHSNWLWQTGLPCFLPVIWIDHWLHKLVLCIHYFSPSLSAPPLPNLHIFYIATLTLNSTPCCPPARLFPPISVLPLVSPPLPISLVPPLQGEPQWDWAAEKEQDDCLHHRTVGHGAHMQCSGTETRQTNHPAHGCVSYEVFEREWQHQRRRDIQTILSHWPGIKNPNLDSFLPQRCGVYVLTFLKS